MFLVIPPKFPSDTLMIPRTHPFKLQWRGPYLRVFIDISPNYFIVLELLLSYSVIRYSKPSSISFYLLSVSNVPFRLLYASKFPSLPTYYLMITIMCSCIGGISVIQIYLNVQITKDTSSLFNRAKMQVESGGGAWH